MRAGHVHALYVHGTSRVHRLEAHVKVAAMLLFVLAVVATPRQAFWAFGIHAMLVGGATAAARIPPGFLLRRLLLLTPFVLFAVFLPFFGGGARTEVAGLSLSVEGLWGAWTILAKATLGVTASIVMAATTEVPDILLGLDRLRVPRLITAIAGFMIRYLDVVLGEMHRMRIAMMSRGYDPRWIWQGGALAASAGALFIRSYERGERVYQAMVARGYEGEMPVLSSEPTRAGSWFRALALPSMAWMAAVTAIFVT
ncbi:MAG TPA: cobalt ECF transporter T component CbiQ [Acidimicrobiia bacterium]|nr:cobalt ECF transporter T component CbiQ [Acidimicrobiia bacterium]